jgi:hypothetical protein
LLLPTSKLYPASSRFRTVDIDGEQRLPFTVWDPIFPSCADRAVVRSA